MFTSDYKRYYCTYFRNEGRLKFYLVPKNLLPKQNNEGL
jgi:hypothetical protein